MKFNRSAVMHTFIYMALQYPFLSVVYFPFDMASESTNEYPFTIFSESEIIQRLPFWFGEDLDALEVNLSDSTNGKRIGIPGRGRYCDHIDIVDVMNSTRATESGEIDWMCPVCGLESLHTDDIIVDELLLNILSELTDEDPDETVRSINLKIDGTWSHVSDDASSRLPMRRKKRSRLTLDEARAVFSGEPIEQSTVEVVDSSSSDDNQPVIDLDSD